MKTKLNIRSWIGLCTAIVALYGSALSQTRDEINRFELYMGFSYANLNTGFAIDEGDEFEETFGGRVRAPGVNISMTGNLTKFVGVKFDFSGYGVTKKGTALGTSFEHVYGVQNFLGGVQIKNNKKDGPRFKPFAHVLAGVARQASTLETFLLPDELGQSSVRSKSTNFAFAAGGGLDIKISKRIDFRAIQFDYTPTYVKDRELFNGFELSGTPQHNYRFGMGIVIH